MREHLDAQLIVRLFHAAAIVSAGERQAQHIFFLAHVVHPHAEAGYQPQLIQKILAAIGLFVVGTGVQTLSRAVNIRAHTAAFIGRQAGEKLRHRPHPFSEPIMMPRSKNFCTMG